MNFLAHSLLAFDDPALLAGQVAGDFVRGRDLGALPARVALGVRLHRAVDAFTDSHPASLDLRERFSPCLRRYAGIALDIGCDHHIARDWSRHGEPLCGLDLIAYASRVDATLRAPGAGLPPAAVRFAAFSANERLFESWATTDGVQRTLVRLSHRAPGFAPLLDCAAELERLDAPIARMVDRLWPAVIEFVRDRLDACSASDKIDWIRTPERTA